MSAPVSSSPIRLTDPRRLALIARSRALALDLPWQFLPILEHRLDELEELRQPDEPDLAWWCDALAAARQTEEPS